VFMFSNFNQSGLHNNTCVALAIYDEASTIIGLEIGPPLT
jgi:hypothetical protein